MTQPIHLDANVILRFLRNDDHTQSPQAARLLQQAQTDESIELVVSSITVMEVFNVLVHPYKMMRKDAAQLLGELLETGVLSCPDLSVLLDALSRITTQRTSFGDAYLAATNARQGYATIATFDEGLIKQSDLSIHQWS